MNCAYCGYSPVKEGEKCPACGHLAGKKASGEAQAGSLTSAILKYADFLDNDRLYTAACCKLNGVATKEDKKQAFEIFRVLAFRGHLDGMYKLAELYLEGEEKDEEAALTWLKIAADAGHKPSKIKLKILKGTALSAMSGSLEIPENAAHLSDLVRQTLPSVVVVRASKRENGSSRGSQGSGFLLEGGYVVTNAHVTGENPEYLSAEFEPSVDERTYNLIPVKISPEHDIAILRFTGLADDKFTKRSNLHLCVRRPAFGEEVYTIGSPLGIGLSVARGVVSNPAQGSTYLRKVPTVIQTDLTANHGNSGGGIFNSKNEVLGIITYTPGNSEGGITMCIPAEYIVTVLNQI